MLARVARLLFVAWFVILAALLVHGAQQGWTSGVWIGLAILLLGHPALLGVELLLSRRIALRAGGPHASWRDLLRAWLGEWIVSTVVFGWRLPWRSHAIADHTPKTVRGLRGVVFIHGFICNRGIWNPWLARLLALDRAFVAVDLEHLFGDIDGYAPTIEAAVHRVEAATGLAPVIVAHSMGGLVARAWLRTRVVRARSDGHDDVARIITIATPHRGTWLAALAMSRNARQMRTGSDWMTGLAGAEPPHLAALFTCWWSECDQIVFPPPTAVLPGSEGRQIRGVAHVALTEREEIWAELKRRLDN